MKRQRKQGRFKKRRVAGAATVLLFIVVVAAAWREMKAGHGDAASNKEGENVATKHELTEEEIEILESQEGVTVSEDGIMEIDISEQFAR